MFRTRKKESEKFPILNKVKFQAVDKKYIVFSPIYRILKYFLKI